MTQPDLTIVGGGLAGSEAAWQAAQHGLNVVSTRCDRLNPPEHILLGPGRAHLLEFLWVKPA